MTEREKMLAGENYNTRDDELIELYWRARAALAEFGQSMARRDRMEILQPIIGQLAEDVWIEPPFFCEYGAHVEIGPRTFINVNCFLQDSGNIKIGADCLLGPGVQLCCARHPLDASQRVVSEPANGDAPYTTSSQPITIGNKVWIGANVTIVGGVTVGDEVVIGAGSVVTKDVPAGMLVRGVPARIVGPTA
ncbi:sugar O-acetyltransferase [Persicirhabdus sediminis]|nr:sugar O-acetyltransferase [Persicirhabdus sediminis]